jgi:hypothetical protein
VTEEGVNMVQAILVTPVDLLLEVSGVVTYVIVAQTTVV